MPASAPVTGRIAVLSGLESNPYFVTFFPRQATFGPDAPKGWAGKPVVEWVKSLPGRRWVPEESCWHITATGIKASPRDVLESAGFEVRIDPMTNEPLRHRAAGEPSLGFLVPPMAKLDDNDVATVLVRTRMSGYEATVNLLGPSAIWKKDQQWFEAGTTEVFPGGQANPRIIAVGRTLEVAEKLTAKAHAAVRAPAGVDSSVLSLVAASDGKDVTAELDHLRGLVGDIPDWFGLDLFEFQKAGVLAAAAGRQLLSDDPGLGKTRQALGAVAMSGAKRLIIVCPPLVVTHWGREATQSGIAQHALAGENLESEGGRLPEAPPTGSLPAPSDKTSMTPSSGERMNNLLAKSIAENVVLFRAGRKEPELPSCGVVVVPDSLLAKRPELLAHLQSWEADAMIYDEVHRAKTWTSARAKSGRALAETVNGPRIAISGTPMFANPVELASPLAITGHLTPVFGGYTPFVTRYAKQNHFRAWVPRKEMLGELRERLNASVWVRRHKKDVLPDLPPKLRSAEVVDVNLKEFHAAHKDVVAKVTEWLKTFKADPENKGKWPTLKQMESFGAESIGLISPLRRAAGLAKVPLAAEWVSEWLASNTDTEIVKDGAGSEVARRVYSRPLVVWAHHIEVVAALSEACGLEGVGVIDGSTSSQNRGDLVDEFQDGKIGVLICSITAAGVGITLTRGSDMLFVETDWTPALIIQAEDRQQRIGASANHILIRTMIAEGTLDGHIQNVLATKQKTLDAVMGGDNNVAVHASEDEMAAPRQIIVSIAVEALAKLDKSYVPV